MCTNVKLTVWYNWLTQCVWLVAAKLTYLAMELLQALFTSEASLSFVDLLPLAEEIKNLQIVGEKMCLCTNGSVISLTNYERKQRGENCNNISILIGCLHHMTV